MDFADFSWHFLRHQFLFRFYIFSFCITGVPSICFCHIWWSDHIISFSVFIMILAAPSFMRLPLHKLESEGKKLKENILAATWLCPLFPLPSPPPPCSACLPSVSDLCQHHCQHYHYHQHYLYLYDLYHHPCQHYYRHLMMPIWHYSNWMAFAFSWA